MFLIKEGYPEEDELVLCTVTNIHFHSVFVKLDEYKHTGLIHISEISPGRIRNIRDYVVEGKKIVCKVLRVDTVKGHIDLSLRRVNANQRRIKINEIKQEQKAEKILEQIARLKKKDPKSIYDTVAKKVFTKYENLTSCFKEVVKNESILENLELDKELVDQMLEMIRVRFKEEEVVIGGALKLTSYAPDGLEVIKKSIKKAEDVSKKVNISYAGGGSYRIGVTSNSYKDAEKILDKSVANALSFTKKGQGIGEFIRKEKE